MISEFVSYDDNDAAYRDTPLVSNVPKPTLSYITSLGPTKKKWSKKKTFFKKPQKKTNDELLNDMAKLKLT